MYEGDEKDYFGGLGGKKPVEKKEMPMKEEKGEEDGDEGVTTHTHKRGGKYHTTVDRHDGMPPDEMEHDSHEEATEAHAKALEEKYGEEQTEDAEEHVSPGIHEKVGSYLKHMKGGEE